MSKDYPLPADRILPLAVRTPTAAAPSRDGARTVALVVLCQFVHGLTFTAIPLLLPLIRTDLQIDFTQAGMLSAAATLSYALGQVPAGYLSDRFGPRRLIFIGLLGWSSLSLCFGLIHDFRLALVDQFLAGAFRSMLFAPGLALLASWFPGQRRATALSLYMLGGFAGNVLISLAAPLAASVYGWRSAFVLLGLPGIAVAFVFKHLATEKPRREGAHIGLGEAFGVARYPIMWVCSSLQLVRFSAVTAFNVWLPSLLVADRGFSVQAAGAMVAIGAAFTALSNTLGGYVCDRWRNPPLVIGAALAILACSSILLVLVDTGPLLVAVVAVNAIFLQFYFGALFLVPVEVLGARFTGSASGFGNLFANIGGFVTAYSLGLVKDRTGSFSAGFVCVGAMCLVGVILSMLLARMRKRALAAAIATPIDHRASDDSSIRTRRSALSRRGRGALG